MIIKKLFFLLNTISLTTSVSFQNPETCWNVGWGEPCLVFLQWKCFQRRRSSWVLLPVATRRSDFIQTCNASLWRCLDRPVPTFSFLYLWTQSFRIGDDLICWPSINWEGLGCRIDLLDGDQALTKVKKVNSRVEKKF